MKVTNYCLTHLKMDKVNNIVDSSDYGLTGLVSKLILPKEKIYIVPLCVGDSFKPVNNEILNQRK